ncbi:hypothetical protein Ddye_002024 [Dipteronia dyeriana]|uniref:Transposase n=1 Tax=Dipteronia dyeriana TaxID=168575 RepID=A0AAD9XQ11_9ROSI|nr:hypothetical protein Ddye_002024 [Dipteronia dyeriana]
MDPTKLVITYGGKWMGNFSEGGETVFVKVCKNLTYIELSRVVQSVANVDLTRFSIELRTLVDTGLVYQSFVQQLTAQFQSGGGSNNVLGSIPTTDHVFQTPTGNPVIFEDPTINEVLAEPYNKDESSIPEYNSYSEYGLEDFDEDYIGDVGSCEGVNDEELKKAIGCPTNCIIIFDRSPAIKVAMVKEYPEIPHGLCGFHMNMNLKNRFKSHVVYKLFHEASMAHRQTEFLEKMRELSRVNMRAYEYLIRVDPHKWSRAYCPVRRDRGMTSNIVECMNNCLRYARQLPITTLVEYVRDMMQKWFHERRDAVSRNTTQLSRWATEKLTKKK